jgi:hypothetical protein
VNFTLATSLGVIDLLREVTRGRAYEALAQDTVQIELYRVGCPCLSREHLIQVKRAAVRPRDSDAAAELEGILARHRS